MDSNQIAVASPGNQPNPVPDNRSCARCGRPAAPPSHVAMILDGNRRWARMWGRRPVDGHREGAARLFDTVQWCDEAGVGTLTLWVLSVCNLARPAEELSGLMPLIVEVIDGLAARRRWPIRHLGQADLLPVDLQTSLRRAVVHTDGIEGMAVNMAVGYDGRSEIAAAIRLLADRQDLRAMAPADIEHALSQHLYTRGQPDPDLIIRTSGEQRLSGFMLWQSANSELYFSDVLWPQFTREDLQKALDSYASRERRYGM